ncbi:winged helix-turn-helix domain-containing protein [Enterococcus crotali]|uniref:winged helix-turn-helix domain-containing protein n=1 Tax=Enterococcus crotali TaxID=1453587 RepID=UPI00046ECE02|nr:winged helix-turn-helix domain-containing protein [Enterococcus crotali]
MFNIAIVNNDGNSNSAYIKALEEKKCVIHQMDFDELAKELSGIHAVLITESGVENIGQTYEWIIKTRSLSNCFIWVLSREATKINRIIHLQLGADGTLDSEIDLEEFSLYIMKTLERRAVGQNQLESTSSARRLNEEDGPFDIRLISGNSSVKIDGKNEIALTDLEFSTLELLIERKGQAVTYEELYENIWGEEEGDKKYRVANLVFHLRKKLNDDSFKSKYIRTVRSRGYMLPRY